MHPTDGLENISNYNLISNFNNCLPVGDGNLLACTPIFIVIGRSHLCYILCYDY